MNKEMNIDETLAVLASDVKKLIKHFKLDRRRQGEEESPTAVEESAPDNETIQQIATAVKEISERKLFTEEQIDSLNRIINAVGHYFHKGSDERHIELKGLIDIITNKLDEYQAAPQKTVTRREHYFTVDFRNSKAALTMTIMALVIVISSGFNIHQASRNSDLRDNDIKYRYIKMQGEASAADIYRLESIFEYDRNADSMKIIRRQIEDFERLVKEYNEKQYRIRQDEARAREIEQEAATVKGNK